MSDCIGVMFAPSADPSEAAALLSAKYGVVAEPVTSMCWTFLDTADWRLHRAGWTLRQRRVGQTYELVLTAAAGDELVGASRGGSWPRRLEALPASSVREQIAAVVGERALLALAEVDARVISLQLRDELGKVRARVRIEQQRLVAPRFAALPLLVVVLPLRGYDRDARRCAALLRDGQSAMDLDESSTVVTLTAAGWTPGLPAAGRAVNLAADAPAVSSLGRVLLGRLDGIDAAWQAVIDDVDPEFLHDLRTSVRATRSILTLSGPLLADGHSARFAAEFAWLGRLTTPMRDLDVMMRDVAGRGAVGVSGLNDLRVLHQHLVRRRRAALRTLRDGLQSQRAKGLRVDWRAALEHVANDEAPGPTTLSFVREQAQATYRRVITAAAPVDAGTRADELHRLRRRCKRMRYLLDGFSSVYKPDPLHSVLSNLKKLQDCLGDIQDSDVQQRHLADVASHLLARGAPAATVMNMGALHERIGQRDLAARQVLAARLAHFTRLGPTVEALTSGLA